jgi:hypothetical protein
MDDDGGAKWILMDCGAGWRCGTFGADGGTVADWAVCAAGERESGDFAAGFFDVS